MTQPWQYSRPKWTRPLQSTHVYLWREAYSISNFFASIFLGSPS